jgi:hypothetical protein
LKVKTSTKFRVKPATKSPKPKARAYQDRLDSEERKLRALLKREVPEDIDYSDLATDLKIGRKSNRLEVETQDIKVTAIKVPIRSNYSTVAQRF